MISKHVQSKMQLNYELGGFFKTISTTAMVARNMINVRRCQNMWYQIGDLGNSNWKSIFSMLYDLIADIAMVWHSISMGN